jgi:hypothetical protein
MTNLLPKTKSQIMTDLDSRDSIHSYSCSNQLQIAEDIIIIDDVLIEPNFLYIERSGIGS